MTATKAQSIRLVRSFATKGARSATQTGAEKKSTMALAAVVRRIEATKQQERMRREKAETPWDTVRDLNFGLGFKIIHRVRHARMLLEEVMAKGFQSMPFMRTPALLHKTAVTRR
jgi:hypothetical protein